MRTINNFINESNNDQWIINTSVNGAKQAKVDFNNSEMLWFNLDSQVMAPMSNDDIRYLEHEDQDLANAIEGLKVGESYDADGGINIYMRIA